jgi:hypothetical protein
MLYNFMILNMHYSQVKCPVELFHTRLLEYWRISRLIRMTKWRRLSEEDSDKEQLSKNLAELVWLLISVQPPNERNTLIDLFIMPSPTSKTGILIF